MAEQEAEGTPAKKTSPLIMLIVSLAVVTVIGGGGGWFVGTLIAPSISAAEKAKKEQEAADAKKPEAGKKPDDAGLPHIATEANGIVQLEPITSNLAYPSENWVRLEVALMFKGPPDVKMAEDIHQDILAYIRTVSLQQIEGPRGFQYLRDDIQERVDLRSEGRVSKVMFRTFVIE
ncbi:flagellar basal body protein FliL [Neorhizobium sp. P12A]|jgi:flagellar FliL protein|uniref:flagellar basal body-associated FliL family protein n=1 Tax=Rhizobium/Agrobacterium group TaxID=227290 RepID=UPI0010484B85|nr:MULTISPECIES: flagellar basal body-associated FliL family protein [Rhizobium/Agrobacterium group]KAA0699511.1 flagellar basal body protein FliL [Neorhizobium sp. P12A]TCR91112.1 flagellar FliL protein [Rhizobium sp. BK376]